MKRVLVLLLCQITAAHAVANDAIANDATEITTAKTGWIKTFATAPVEPGAEFETPDFHTTLIETAARNELAARLVTHGYARSDEGEGDDERLTFSVSVEAPGPKGHKPLPKSPVQISSYDRDLTDNINDQKVYAEIVDLPRRTADAPPEIRVTIYARRGETRFWSGYAGAPAGGASREEIARGLVAALVDYFGASVDLPRISIPLTAHAPAVQIVETPAQ